MVGATGFEPATLCPPGKYATRLRYAPTFEAINLLSEKVLVNKTNAYSPQGHAVLGPREA